MTIPGWLQTVLTAFETSEQPFMEVALFEAVRNAVDADPEQAKADKSVWVAEMFLFEFIPTRPRQTSPWGTYFSPMAVFANEDGSEVRIPDIGMFDADSVAHWEERARAVTQPVMRARYADGVWDLKRVITAERPSHEFAQMAIDSYITAADTHRYTHHIEGVQWLRRALDLSLSMRDTARAGHVVDAILRLYDAVAAPRHIGLWVSPFDTLYGRKNLLTPEQEERIIADLEKMLAITSVHGKEGFDAWGAEAAADRLAQHYKRKGDTANVHRVIKAYGDAFVALARQATGMHATAWLQPVIERYEQVGLKQDAEALQLLMSEKAKNIESEMKTVSVPVELTKEQIEGWLNELVAGDLATALRRIAVYFVPKVADSKALLERMRTETPFLSMISVTRFDVDGRPTGKIGSIEDDPDGRLHQQLEQSMGFMQPFLVMAIDRVRERDHSTIDHLLAFLKESPLFANSDDSLLKAGLEAYFAGDFIKAIHILVPRVERSLRDLLSLLGIPTVKTVPRHPGIRDAKNMNDVLEDERVRTALTEDVWRYLSVLYIDRRGGLNLRNNLAHGLLRDEAFNRAIAGRVVHSLLVLSLVRRAEAPESGE